MTGVDPLTVPAVTRNVAEDLPAGIVTLAGTLAAPVFELDRDIAAPPLPAGAVNVTVPVPVAPLAIVVGLTLMVPSAPGKGEIVILLVELVPP